MIFCSFPNHPSSPYPGLHWWTKWRALWLHLKRKQQRENRWRNDCRHEQWLGDSFRHWYRNETWPSTEKKKEKEKKVFDGVNYAIAFNCCVSFFFFLSIITDNGARYLDSILHSFQRPTWRGVAHGHWYDWTRAYTIHQNTLRKIYNHHWRKRHSFKFQGH